MPLKDNSTEIARWLQEQSEFKRRDRNLRTKMGRAVQPLTRAIKANAPAPGYPGDKPGVKALRDTIGYVLRDYRAADGGIVYYVGVGPLYPEGAHGHLVEFGHRQVTGGTLPRELDPSGRQRRSRAGRTGQGQVKSFVDPQPFAEPAVEQTGDQVRRSLEEAFTISIEQQFRRNAPRHRRV